MCGIFGIYDSKEVDHKLVRNLASHAEQRGIDSSGFLYHENNSLKVIRASLPATKLLKKILPIQSNFVMGHSRLITNGESDNQPIVKDGIVVIHNGIILNSEVIWDRIPTKREQEIDTEVIAAIAKEFVDQTGSLRGVFSKLSDLCEGAFSCAIVSIATGQLALFSNTGSMYFFANEKSFIFSSEKYPIEKYCQQKPEQILNQEIIFDISILKSDISVTDFESDSRNLIPKINFVSNEEKLLLRVFPEVNRCTKCILPETMPFINFDEHGVCNYCKSYKSKSETVSFHKLIDLVENYRRVNQPEVIIPFSGGRDSSFGLHLAVRELGLKAIAYTYDWGMLTDLGRRNASLMTSKLGVENIIVAADIVKKRQNISKNLKAWLNNPNLGMVSILTAGDKHFFKHVDTIKNQTNIKLNLWGINPLEVTHFKSGFLGIEPDFESLRVYSHGGLKQIRYQAKRLQAMTKSRGYFNSSIFDTLSGEYYRSFAKKKDYFHIFDYWRWDENQINNLLLNEYEWELAEDTSTTWRIGDGTAGFYNYVYHTIAGLTEHDTLRSNQVREGQLSREEALSLIYEENRPRYKSIKWYLETLGFDYNSVINTINAHPRLY